MADDQNRDIFQMDRLELEAEVVRLRKGIRDHGTHIEGLRSLLIDSKRRPSIDYGQRELFVCAGL